VIGNATRMIEVIRPDLGTGTKSVRVAGANTSVLNCVASETHYHQILSTIISIGCTSDEYTLNYASYSPNGFCRTRDNRIYVLRLLSC